MSSKDLSSKNPSVSSRMLALDLLRGFFIVVIIIDHLYRWPSLFTFITGQGKLWVSSAEGFVMISGLLIGYVRGYKNRELPMVTITKKLLHRALILYIWLFGATIVYTLLAWYIPTAGNLPYIQITKGDLGWLIYSSLTASYAHEWVFFLYIYTFLLAVSPIIIYWLRLNKIVPVILLTFIGYIIGRQTNTEWLQWMPMFYLPAVAGFYLPAIKLWWTKISSQRHHILLYSLYGVFGFTFICSAITTFIFPDVTVSMALNNLFSKQYFFPAARIPMAILWFGAFVMLFDRFKTNINRWFGKLLLSFGTSSLTTYIVHGIILFIIALLLDESPNVWYNTAMGIVAVVATWILVRQKLIQKFVPQ